LPVLAADTTALTATVNDPAATTATLTGVTALVEEYGAHMLIGDEADDYTLKGSFDAAKEMLAYKALRSFDGLIYTIAKTGLTAATEDGGTIASASVSAEANHGFLLTNLEYMAYEMRKNNVRQYVEGPFANTWIAITHPRCIQTMRASTGTREYIDLAKNIGGQVGLEALQTAFVGRACGFSVLETTEATSALTHAATTSYAYDTILAGYECVGAVSLQGGSGTGVPKKGTGRLIRRPRARFRTNAELIVKPIGSSGSLDAMNRRGSVAYKFRTAITLLDTNRCRHWLPWGYTA